MQPFELSLSDAARAVHARELSPVELTESVLDRIQAVEGRLGAYVTVDAEAALAAAVRAEREIAGGGPRGPLHGIPMGLKDLIDVEGMPTTASSHVRAGHARGSRQSWWRRGSTPPGPSSWARRTLTSSPTA